MKKNFLCILLLLISCISVFASVSSIELGTGNDLFSMAVNDNYDDQLSFNAFANIGLEKHKISLYFDSYTDRYSSRLDVLNIYDNLNYKRGNLDCTLKYGVSLSGTLYFQMAQNILHTKMDIPIVELDYDYKFKVLPVLGAEVSYSEYFKNNISASFNLSLDNVIGLYSMQTVSANLLLSDISGIGLGYRFYEPGKKSETIKSFKQYNNGILTNFFVDSGFFKFSHYAVLSEGFGFGSISFNFMKFFEKSQFTEESVVFSMGTTTLMMGKTMPTFKNITYSYKVKENLFAYIDNNFEAGCSMIVPSDYDETARREHRNIRKISFVTSGINYEFTNFKYFKPSVKAGIGFLYANYSQLNYTEKEYAIRKNLTENISFVANAGLTVSVLPKNMVKIAKSNLNLSLYAGSYFVASPEKMTQIIQSDGSGNKVNYFVPYYGFAFRTGIDK